MKVGEHEFNMPENRYIKGLIWFSGIAVGLIVSTLSANNYLDGRYMLVGQATQQFSTLQTQTEFLSDKQRKLYIEDQLFKLDQIPKAKMTGSEAALKAKYERELDDLNRTWIQRGRTLK